MKLVLKSHQAALRFDKNFVEQGVTEANFNWNRELLMITGTSHQRSANHSNKGKREKDTTLSANIGKVVVNITHLITVSM
jgi:hypothetical protein